MKKIILTSLILIAYTSCDSNNSDDEQPPVIELTIQERLDNNETPLEIYNSGILLSDIYGKTYKGGHIFYLDTNTGKGMVTGFQDNSSGMVWGGCNYPNVTSSELWSGQDNTTELATYCDSEYVGDNPIKVCLSLEKNGYSDWFLPSKNELIEMTTNLFGMEGIYFGATSGYWSSSNIDFDKIWTVSAYDSNSTETYKNPSYNPYDHRVRAIRYFDE
tara:strand:- start:137 stop:787 length:651 start_codon:yes stop_codon:yes gene_type:complete